MRRELGIGAALLAAVAAAALGAAHLVGGSVTETWGAVTRPDLLEESRAFAGAVAAAGVLAGGVALALALVASLRRPAEADEAALDARIERSLARTRVGALEGHVVACGAHDLLRLLADELGRRGVPTVVVERDEERAGRARLFLSHVLAGDPWRAETLRAAGLERAAAVALCGLPERERARVAGAAAEADPDVAVAAVHDAAGARLFAEALVSGEAGRARGPRSSS